MEKYSFIYKNIFIIFCIFIKNWNFKIFISLKFFKIYIF